jgi:pimeloyl-ACP methyl ester carboxylesterase
VYLADQRGTGLSNFINCASPPTAPSFDPYNATIIAQYDACNVDLVNKYGSTLAFYSVHHAAEDLKAVIDAVAPTKVSIYALSFGTYITNVYLQLPGARADAVVLDGPVPPNRWALENNAPWVSVVGRDILKECATYSAACSAHLGSIGHLPRFIMDSIIDGTLPCLAKLPWLNQHMAAYYNSFLTLNGPAHVLHGPFWWRLYRCSASDVDQLNVFHAYKTAHDVLPSAPDYSYGVAAVIGSSEVYSFSQNPMSWDEQVSFTARQYADASPQFVVARARRVIPLYTPNPATYRKFARPTAPVLIMVGTLDPNTPHGLARWFADGLGPSATVVSVPFAAHGTLSYDAPCAISIIMGHLLNFGSISPDLTCLNSIAVPDFDGVSSKTQQMSQQYFNTTNLWNDNPIIPPFPAPSPPTPCPSSSSSSSSSTDSVDKDGYIAGIVVLSVLSATLIVVCTLLSMRLMAEAKRSAARLGNAGGDSEYSRMVK